MAAHTLVHGMTEDTHRGKATPPEACLLVLFGASGDLTRRLLMPALLNLACDGVLPEHFAIVGIARDEYSTEQFRAHLTEEVRKFCTRPTFDSAVWDRLAARIHYVTGDFADPEAYRRLAEVTTRVGAEQQTGDNLLFYLAVAPSLFGPVSARLDEAGFRRRDKGWTRLIVEKPFGHDLASATRLNRDLLAHWSENQVYRIDHYLGKETVQNLLAFRFSNGIFEPLWNKTHVDHIQMTVAETVGVEGRGRYYDGSGVLRDMVQNHMFQMLAYLCMEPPSSLRAEPVRNEKAKLLEAVRIMTPDDVDRYTVRGQYGPGRKPDGTPAAGYRQEPDVNPASRTETFAAMRLFIDNWRWEGVPIYLRSGKALWKRGTEIAVQFRKAPEVIFRDTPAGDRMESNRLLFHVQPDQGIELRFQAKAPGSAYHLQKVNMRFDYRESFEAARGTGYEVLLYSAMIGDATLFSRDDLIEQAWRIAQPILDRWSEAEVSFPNYPAGSWGPKEAFNLIERDGRHWVEIINRSVLERVELFREGDPIFLHNLAMSLRPTVCVAGDYVLRKGEMGSEMYFICRGEVEVEDGNGQVLARLGEGEFFGELSLLFDEPRTASIRAATVCDLFVLERPDFERVLKDYPAIATRLREIALSRTGKGQAET